MAKTNCPLPPAAVRPDLDQSVRGPLQAPPPKVIWHQGNNYQGKNGKITRKEFPPPRLRSRRGHERRAWGRRAVAPPPPQHTSSPAQDSGTVCAGRTYPGISRCRSAQCAEPRPPPSDPRCRRRQPAPIHPAHRTNLRPLETGPAVSSAPRPTKPQRSASQVPHGSPTRALRSGGGGSPAGTASPELDGDCSTTEDGKLRRDGHAWGGGGLKQEEETALHAEHVGSSSTRKCRKSVTGRTAPPPPRVFGAVESSRVMRRRCRSTSCWAGLVLSSESQPANQRVPLSPVDGRTGAGRYITRSSPSPDRLPRRRRRRGCT